MFHLDYSTLKIAFHTSFKLYLTAIEFENPEGNHTKGVIRNCKLKNKQSNDQNK
jgi:hypothetical protein